MLLEMGRVNAVEGARREKGKDWLSLCRVGEAG